MKKYIVTSLLFFVPLVAGADDYCTNPDKYTVDKRCYVTDEQKTQKPYNSVVRITTDWYDDFCTGTIVKGNDGKPYVYTAKHCAHYSNVGPMQAHIKLQNNSEQIIVKPYAFGDGLENETVKRPFDWAVYTLPESRNAEFLKIAVEKTNNVESINKTYKAQVVGYGALKIMSDEELGKLKEDYIKYMKGDTTGIEHGGLDGTNDNVKSFLNRKDILNDGDNLKKSDCQYGQKGGKGCQGWGGNSGGPVFDDKGKIMAVVTWGASYIGGEYHAEITENAPDTTTAHSVSLLKTNSKKPKDAKGKRLSDF